MFEKQKFIESISSGYQPKGDYIFLGAAIHGGEVFPDAAVKIPLKIMIVHNKLMK